MRNGGFKTWEDRQKEKFYAQLKAEAMKHPVVYWCQTMLIWGCITVIFFMAANEFFQHYIRTGNWL